MNTNELIPKAEDKIVCVKVGKIKRENLYEMTRKYWKVKLERASRATHVLAVVEGKVEAVYSPKQWFYTKDTGLYGRSANPVKYINL